MLRKIIGTKKNWIDFGWSFDKGFSLAFSGYLKTKWKHFTITFFSLKRIEPHKGYIDFRVRFPGKGISEQWFDITIADHALNFGWL